MKLFLSLILAKYCKQIFLKLMPEEAVFTLILIYHSCDHFPSCISQ